MAMVLSVCCVVLAVCGLVPMLCWWMTADGFIIAPLPSANLAPAPRHLLRPEPDEDKPNEQTFIPLQLPGRQEPHREHRGGGPAGRQIRPLACVSKADSSEAGVCMFAWNCVEAGGKHLGTCVDRYQRYNT